MKTLSLFLVASILGFSAVRIHSQAAPAATAGAALLQMKTANEDLIARQAATLQLLKTMEADSNQMRIVAKRK